MATDNKPSARDIFSNITVKQSMSSLNESPEVERSGQVLNFAEMQKQLLRENRHNQSELSKTHYDVYMSRDSISQARMRKPSVNVINSIHQTQNRILFPEVTPARTGSQLQARKGQEQQPVTAAKKKQIMKMANNRMEVSKDGAAVIPETSPKTEDPQEEALLASAIITAEPLNHASSADMRENKLGQQQQLVIEHVSKLYFDRAQLDNKITSHEIRHDSKTLRDLDRQQVESTQRQFNATDNQSNEVDFSKSRGIIEPEIIEQVPYIKESAKAQTPGCTKRKKNSNKPKASQKKLAEHVQVMYQLRRDDQTSPPLEMSRSIVTHAKLSSEHQTVLSQPLSQPQVVEGEPSNEGLSAVQRLVKQRVTRDTLRDGRIRQNRFLGSTKTAYSTNYRDFTTQSVMNIKGVYSNGDRSASTRRLVASELNLRLPEIEQERVKAIEYIVPHSQGASAAIIDDTILSGYESKKQLYSSRFVKDTINDSTKDGYNSSMNKVVKPGDKEQTTGWHFATQIETDEEDLIGHSKELFNRSALMLAKRDMLPSMLDPAFEEEECPSPATRGDGTMSRSVFLTGRQGSSTLAERKNMEIARQTVTNKRFMAPIVKQQACNDYLFMDTMRKPASILEVFSQSGRRPNGIKEFAWKGVPADSDGRMTHHHDKEFTEAWEKRQQEMKTDGLPCNVLEVPRQLYVNSDVRLRRTSEVLRKYMREQIYRGEFDMFMNSREGKNYYLGILPTEEKPSKIRVSRSNAAKGTKESLTNASTRRSSLTKQKSLKRRRDDGSLEDRGSQSSQIEMDKLPDDMMVVLIQNHKQRDESIRMRKENARKLLKDKQQAAQEQAEKSKKMRLQGQLLPEDIERQNASRRSAEQFLLQMRRKREAREGKMTKAQEEALFMMSQKHKRREETEEHKQNLKETIAKFNRNCYSKKAGNQQMLRELLASPREHRK